MEEILNSSTNKTKLHSKDPILKDQDVAQLSCLVPQLNSLKMQTLLSTNTLPLRLMQSIGSSRL